MESISEMFGSQMMDGLKGEEQDLELYPKTDQKPVE